MKKASAQWLESAEMDLGSIGQIIRREDLTPVAVLHSLRAKLFFVWQTK